eukprot:4702351-Heterocapsa_arctica.AAC.1
MDFIIPHPTIAPTSLWSDSKEDFTMALPFHSSSATPPDLPAFQSSVLLFLMAGFQSPCQPLWKAIDFKLSMFASNLQCSWINRM